MSVESKSTEEANLTCDMIQSMTSYSKASALERRCIFVVVVRTEPGDVEDYCKVFRQLDADGDGAVTRVDLNQALRESTAITYPFDVDALFKAADLNDSQSLDVHEFVSACLHTRLAPLDGWLADEAFSALDRDQDGFLQLMDVLPIFGKDMPASFASQVRMDISEWRQCILNPGSGLKLKTGKKPVQAEIPQAPCGFMALDLFGAILPENCSNCSSQPTNDFTAADTIVVGDTNVELSALEAPKDDLNFNGLNSRRVVEAPPPAPSRAVAEPDVPYSPFSAAAMGAFSRRFEAFNKSQFIGSDHGDPFRQGIDHDDPFRLGSSISSAHGG